MKKGFYPSVGRFALPEFAQSIWAFIKPFIGKATPINKLYLLFILAFPMVTLAQTVTFTTWDILDLDSNNPATGPRAAYVGFRITNNALARPNVTASLTFSCPGFALNGGQVATQEVGIGGTLAPSATDALYWHISYPTTYNTSCTMTVTFRSNGVTFATLSQTVTTESSISANAGGTVGASVLGPGIFVGQILYYDVTYNLGNIKNNDPVNLQPAGNTTFNAGCYQLVDTRILASNVPGVNVGTGDQLFFMASGNAPGSGSQITVRYYFRVNCVGIGTTNVRPYASTQSGQPIKYQLATDLNIPTPVDPLTITKTVTPSNIPNNPVTLPDTITYTVTLTNNTSRQIGVDKITDILPKSSTSCKFQYAGFAPGSYVSATNSSMVPANLSTDTLMWRADVASDSTGSEYKIPAGASRILKYYVIVPACTPEGAYTNKVTATMGQYTTPPASATVTIGNIKFADLSVTKMVNDPKPNFGDTVTFTLKVMNTGSDPATGFVLKDSLPNGYDLGC
jgi:uncharacterized repeat protein (TIGR01451 family)